MIITLLLLTLISCSNQPIKPAPKLAKNESFLTYRHPASFWDIFKTVKENYTPLTLQEKDDLPSVVEKSLVWREKAYMYFSIIQKHRSSNKLNSQEEQLLINMKHADLKPSSNKKVKPLSSFLVKNLHKTFSLYHDIYDEIQEIVSAGEWIFKKNYKITVNAKQPTGEDKEAWHRFSRAQAFGELKDPDEEFKQPFNINPLDEKGQELILKVKRSLAAGLLFYDNFNYAVHFYQKDKKLRSLLNNDNEDNYRLLAEITKYFHSFTYFKRINKTIKFFHAVNEFHTDAQVPFSAFESIENSIIESSQMFQVFDQISAMSLIADKFKYYGQTISLTFTNAFDTTAGSLSQVFGNAVGETVWRKGKLLKLSPKQRQSILNILQPLDIILEKAPFRLSDKFIPGHFGHAAVWIGTKKQLQELKLWDHPTVQPYHGLIESGHSIVEALRPGVQINTLNHFLDIDDLAITRLKEKLSLAKKQQYILNAFAQIGKDYDFNFDVETDTKIVCSELVYVTFDDMQWPTEKTFGRYTITPDNVANKVGVDKEFSTLLIYHDGKKVSTQLENNFSKLLEQSYDNIKFK